MGAEKALKRANTARRWLLKRHTFASKEGGELVQDTLDLLVFNLLVYFIIIIVNIVILIVYFVITPTIVADHHGYEWLRVSFIIIFSSNGSRPFAPTNHMFTVVNLLKVVKCFNAWCKRVRHESMNFPLNDWVVKICSGVQNENVADAALQFVIARKGELALFDFRTLDAPLHMCARLLKEHRGFAIDDGVISPFANDKKSFPPNGQLQDVRHDFGTNVHSLHKHSKIVQSEKSSFFWNKDAGVSCGVPIRVGQNKDPPFLQAGDFVVANDGLFVCSNDQTARKLVKSSSGSVPLLLASVSAYSYGKQTWVPYHKVMDPDREGTYAPEGQYVPFASLGQLEWAFVTRKIGNATVQKIGEDFYDRQGRRAVKLVNTPESPSGRRWQRNTDKKHANAWMYRASKPDRRSFVKDVLIDNGSVVVVERWEQVSSAVPTGARTSVQSFVTHASDGFWDTLHNDDERGCFNACQMKLCLSLPYVKNNPDKPDYRLYSISAIIDPFFHLESIPRLVQIMTCIFYEARRRKSPSLRQSCDDRHAFSMHYGGYLLGNPRYTAAYDSEEDADVAIRHQYPFYREFVFTLSQFSKQAAGGQYNVTVPTVRKNGVPFDDWENWEPIDDDDALQQLWTKSGYLVGPQVHTLYTAIGTLFALKIAYRLQNNVYEQFGPAYGRRGVVSAANDAEDWAVGANDVGGKLKAVLRNQAEGGFERLFDQWMPSAMEALLPANLKRECKVMLADATDAELLALEFPLFDHRYTYLFPKEDDSRGCLVRDFYTQGDALAKVTKQGGRTELVYVEFKTLMEVNNPRHRVQSKEHAYQCLVACSCLTSMMKTPVNRAIVFYFTRRNDFYTAHYDFSENNVIATPFVTARASLSTPLDADDRYVKNLRQHFVGLAFRGTHRELPAKTIDNVYEVQKRSVLKGNLKQWKTSLDEILKSARPIYNQSASKFSAAMYAAPYSLTAADRIATTLPDRVAMREHTVEWAAALVDEVAQSLSQKYGTWFATPDELATLNEQLAVAERGRYGATGGRWPIRRPKSVLELLIRATARCVNGLLYDGTQYNNYKPDRGDAVRRSRRGLMTEELFAEFDADAREWIGAYVSERVRTSVMKAIEEVKNDLVPRQQRAYARKFNQSVKKGDGISEEAVRALFPDQSQAEVARILASFVRAKKVALEGNGLVRRLT